MWIEGHPTLKEAGANKIQSDITAERVDPDLEVAVGQN
jgi:hypothetical protein